MREWIVVASKAEAKVFEKRAKNKNLKWVKTLENKKGRRREREFHTDKPGLSYAKYGSLAGPHLLEGKNSHAEVIATHFAHTIGSFIKQAYAEKRFDTATVFAGPKLLGKIKKQINGESKANYLNFVDKNIEKASATKIDKFLKKLS
ncbi:MAG: host attachment protein [Oligoflexia bacterium]|nr:host attachment protein [Oligoflexia bacterium]